MLTRYFPTGTHTTTTYPLHFLCNGNIRLIICEILGALYTFIARSKWAHKSLSDTHRYVHSIHFFLTLLMEILMHLARWKYVYLGAKSFDAKMNFHRYNVTSTLKMRFYHIGLVMSKPVPGVSYKASIKPFSSATGTSWKTEISLVAN